MHVFTLHAALNFFRCILRDNIDKLYVILLLGVLRADILIWVVAAHHLHSHQQNVRVAFSCFFTTICSFCFVFFMITILASWRWTPCLIRMSLVAINVDLFFMCVFSSSAEFLFILLIGGFDLCYIFIKPRPWNKTRLRAAPKLLLPGKLLNHLTKSSLAPEMLHQSVSEGGKCLSSGGRTVSPNVCRMLRI